MLKINKSILGQIYMSPLFDLSPYCGKNIYSSNNKMITQNRIVLIKIEFGKKTAIEFDIPKYKKYHNERITATDYNIFNVFEYEKHPAYTTEEIDWILFENKLKESLKILIDN